MFSTLNFQSLPLQVGLEGPHNLNLPFTFHTPTKLNFSGRKGLKTGGGVELIGLPAPPTFPNPSLLPLPPFPYLSTYHVIPLEQ